MSQPTVADPHAQPGFRFNQWRMLLAATFCYLFYYTGRQTFGFAIPLLEKDLGLSKTELGWVTSAFFATYGFGQFINGNLGDKFGGRRMMTLGAVGSCAMVWVTSFGHSYWMLLIPWALNGYFQSLGWAPGSRLIANWWSHSERARAFGIYTFGSGMSDVLTFTSCMLILHFGLGWQWIFRLPVLLLLGGGIIFYLIARDTPEELGFAPVSADEPVAVQVGPEDETTLQRYWAALSNWRFLSACLSLGFEDMARYGLVIWVPVYYLGKTFKSDPSTGWITLALPIGMAMGALCGGQLSDRVFKSNRSKPIALMMALAAVCAMTIYFVPKDQRMVGIVMLFLSGFFVFGPQSVFWALCPDLLGTKRAGTGVGVMDAVGYAGAAAAGPLFGAIMEHVSERAVFPAIAVACVLSVVTIAFVRK
jgi:MFS transporter, OPA family, glycerol-3-phosphate transporter